MKGLPAIILLVLFVFSCKKADNIQDNLFSNDQTSSSVSSVNYLLMTSSYGVVNVDRLRFRTENDLYSQTLRYLDKGDIVEILFKDEERVSVGNIENYWYKIRFSGIQGWVFGYYIDLFPNYHSARLCSDNYKNILVVNNAEEQYPFKEEVTESLYYIKDGDLFYIKDLKDYRNPSVVDLNNIYVINYFFSNYREYIYIVGYIKTGRTTEYSSSNIYRIKYDGTGQPEEIYRDIYNATYDFDNNRFVAAKKIRSSSVNQWSLFFLNFNEDNLSKQNIVQIPITTNFTTESEDVLSNTFFKTYGTLMNIDINNTAQFISFTPPDSNKTYIISLLNLDWITVDQQRQSDFQVNEYKVIATRPIDDSKETPKYMMLLIDRFSGMRKELMLSESYPVSATFSSDRMFVSMTMANPNSQNTDRTSYHTDLVIVSLNSYLSIIITDSADCYLPKWFK